MKKLIPLFQKLDRYQMTLIEEGHDDDAIMDMMFDYMQTQTKAMKKSELEIILFTCYNLLEIKK